MLLIVHPSSIDSKIIKKNYIYKTSECLKIFKWYKKLIYSF